MALTGRSQAPPRDSFRHLPSALTRHAGLGWHNVLASCVLSTDVMPAQAGTQFTEPPGEGSCDAPTRRGELATRPSECNERDLSQPHPSREVTWVPPSAGMTML